MTVIDKARIYRELAKLLSASFPMDKAVAMLADQHTSGPRGEFLRGIQSGLEQHLGLAGAMQGHAGHLISPMEFSLVDAGERSGHIAQACEHLAHYFEVWHKGIREARSAMVYPLILLHLGIVLPEFARWMMMKNLRGEDTHIVEALIWRIGGFWLLLAIAAWVWRRLSNVATTSAAMDRAINAVPLLNSVRQHWALARFCQVFHSTLMAGLNIGQCLQLAGDASQSGTLRSGAIDAAKRIEHGADLAGGLKDSGGFSRLFINAMTTAEASGGLDRELQRWATAETDLAVEAQRRVSDWFPKILYFGVVGYVAWRIISFSTMMFSNVMDMANQLK
jgi:type II secretory pathway component PulF